MNRRPFLVRLREFLASRRVERDLAEEIDHHFEMLVEDHERRGLSPEAARAAARQELGGLDQTKERIRDARGLPLLEAFFQDVRYAGRLLRKAPGFTVVAVATLALGIGVNAGIFSLVDAVLLRPLPYPDSSRLVDIFEVITERNGAPGASTAYEVSPANFIDYRQRARSFAGMATYSSAARNLTGAGAPERLTGETVNYSYFAVLGVEPAVGRPFRPEEDVFGADTVVIISDALWRRRFASDPKIVGRVIVLDGQPREIIGVMRPGFRALTSFGTTDAVDFWAPAAFRPDLLTNHGDHEVNVVARLKPGVTMEAARAEMTAISEALAKELPQTNEHVRTGIETMGASIVQPVRTSLLVLLAAVGLVLLMACVNVANLLIVQAVSRRREIAVRFALGATRRRVMAQLVTQSLVLACLGCAAGLVLAVWTRSILVSVAPSTMPRLDTVALDARVVGVTALVSILTGLLFGTLPAWQGGKARPTEAMTGGRIVASTGVLRWRNALMVAEVALSTVLLVGAGLMLKSAFVLDGVQLGFDPAQVVAMNVTLPETRYDTADKRLAFFEELEARVTRLPGVGAAAFANRLPLRGGWSSGFVIEPVSGPPSGSFLQADFQAVSTGYFNTLGIRLLSGRLLHGSDRRDTLPVAVVSEAFARRFLDGRDGVGRRFRRGTGAPWITIVGVVSDVRRGGKTATINPQVYLAAAQTTVYPVRLADLAVRTDLDPLRLVPSIQAQVWDLDKEQPITAIRTLDEILLQRGAERRFQTLLFVLFAGLALALAVVGIYGVVAYAVSQRTPEIGVRMALGADRRSILTWIVGKAAWHVVVGALAGVAGAVALSRYLQSLLFEVEPTDPPAYIAAATILALAGLAGSYIAGRRATRIDPSTALRCE